MDVYGRIYWSLFIILSCVFVLLFIYYTLLPGPANQASWHYFSAEEVAAGRDYHRAQRLVFIFSFLAEAGFLIWFLFSGKAGAFGSWLTNYFDGRYYLSLLVFFLSLWVLLRAVNLPFSVYGGYFLQQRWGFSTQTLNGWWLDYLKGAGLSLILSGIGVLLLFWLMDRRPSSWWFFAAAALGIWLVIQTFFWPLVVAPLFNKFRPVTDPEINHMVHRLADKADISLSGVWVMDASRRTTKANAYLAGLGASKRIVLFDNLLENYSPEEIEAVVAHEMAHWKMGHITRGLILGIVANFGFWFLLFHVLRHTVEIPRGGCYPVHTWGIILLFFLLISFCASPVQNYFSRSMEREADRLSVELIGNAENARRLQVNLARKNLADVSPPAFLEWFSFSHPSTINRIKLLNNIE